MTQRRVILLADVILFVCLFTIAIVAKPLQFISPDDPVGNGYYTNVVKGIDDTLFPDDPYGDALGDFRTGYYDLITLVGRSIRLETDPESLTDFVSITFLIGKIILVVLIFILADSLNLGRNKRWWLVLFATWLIISPWNYWSYDALFRNIMNHGWGAQLVLISALIFALHKRYFIFWVLAGIGIQFHVLSGVHFVICTAPFILISSWNNHKKSSYLGLAIFFLLMLFYWAVYSPSMSPESAKIFVEAKQNAVKALRPSGDLDEYIMDKLLLALTLILTSLAYFRLPKNTIGRHLLGASVASGTLLGLVSLFATELFLALGILETYVIQFQAQRIFVWVSFFAGMLIIMLLYYELFSDEGDPFQGVLIFGMWVTTLVSSVYTLPVFLIAVLGYAFLQTGLFRWLYPNNKKTIIRVFSFLLGTVIILFYFLQDNIGFLDNFESIGELSVIFPAFLTCIVISAYPSLSVQIQRGLLILIGVYIIVFASVSNYNNRLESDQNWKDFTTWIRENTSMTDSFLTETTKHSGFRLMALRTTVDERLGHIAWVNGLAGQQNKVISQQVHATWREGAWDINALQRIARANNVDYIVVRGPYFPEISTVYTLGNYSLIAVTD